MLRAALSGSAIIALGGWCTIQAADWTSWRGPLQTGFWPGPAPATSWSHTGEHVLWSAPVGGRTAPIVMNGRVHVIGPVGEGGSLRERVVSLDEKTGAVVWEQVFNVFHTDIVENRVGWTALAGDAETGNVYAHATGGELFCFSREGEIVWKHSLTEEFGRFTGYGGRIYTPVVDEDRVILSITGQSWGDQAGMAQRFVAFDKRSGKVLWWAAPAGRPLDTTYATPVVATINGRRLLICPGADGWVYGLHARTGATVWKYHFSARPINVSPVVDGNLIYVCHSEENYDTTEMGRVACFDGSGEGDITKAEVWRSSGVDAGYATPALGNGRLYVMDNSATLFALDAATGKQHWSHNLGRIGRGSPIVTKDGVIYVAEQNGSFYMLRDEGDRCAVLDHEQFPEQDSAITEIQGSPTIANGKLFMQTRYGLYCIAASAAGAEVAAPPAEPTGSPQNIDAQLVTPAEVTLHPGETVQFSLRAFAAGAAVKGPYSSQAPKWSVAGLPGSVSDDGAYTAPADGGFAAGLVKAAYSTTKGAAESAARVRIVPRLPISEDFETVAVDGAPAGWINVLQKAKVVEFGGSKALMTLSERPSPLFMRLRTYFGAPIAAGYTIESDMLGTPRAPRWKPDMGLVNARYDMILLGSEPVLRLTTWPAIPRLQKDVPFEWKTDVWYRMKLQVEVKGGQGYVRGKVWPREEAEPAAWTIELVDPYPNKEGSPALYAYAAGTTEKRKGTQVYFDNVKVVPND